MTVEEIKFDISKKFRVNLDFLVLKQNGRVLRNELHLFDICMNDFGIVDLDLILTDEAGYHNVNLDTNVYYSHFTLPDIITVHIVGDDNVGTISRDLVVEIENQSIIKPFLGGYVDKKTNIEYHDAFTQSGPPIERIKFDGVWSRDTQTVDERQMMSDTVITQSTQHFGDAHEQIYIPKLTDNVVQAQNYETYDEMIERIDLIAKVRLIQRNFRRYTWQKWIKAGAAEWRRLVEEQKLREAKRQKENEDYYKKECVVKAFPKTKEDFDALYAQVQMWKEKELKRISEQYAGAPKIAELNILLDKEVQLLNGIDKQRFILQQELKKAKNDQILAALGEPVKWVGYKNSLVAMDTLRNQRARFLTKYYHKLQEDLGAHDRISLLNQLSDIIINENHPAVVELENLFQRERQLLLCSVSDENLEVLRKRELIIYMDIIKFDENKGFEEIIQTKLCRKCNIVRPLKKFKLQTRQCSSDICTQCASLQGPPVDISIYRSILRSIRREERKRGALSSFAFIIQENDIKHIIENIWHGHSVLSQCNIRSELRLPRWKVADDWSPWNCICLAEPEARCHIKILHLDLYYEERIIKDIQSKHSLAKSAFKQLKEIDHVFVESGEWWNVGLDGKTI